MNFTIKHRFLAEFCRAMGNPTRVAIIEEIARSQGPVKEVLEIENYTPRFVLAHIRELKKAGLVRGRTEATRDLNYSLDWEQLDDFKHRIDELFLMIKNHAKQLKDE